MYISQTTRKWLYSRWFNGWYRSLDLHYHNLPFACMKLFFTYIKKSSFYKTLPPESLCFCSSTTFGWVAHSKTFDKRVSTYTDPRRYPHKMTGTQNVRCLDERHQQKVITWAAPFLYDVVWHNVIVCVGRIHSQSHNMKLVYNRVTQNCALLA